MNTQSQQELYDAPYKALLAYLDEAEAAFKKAPKSAYAHMRQVAREKGTDSPEWQAYNIAAEDFSNGAL